MKKYCLLLALLLSITTACKSRHKTASEAAKDAATDTSKSAISDANSGMTNEEQEAIATKAALEKLPEKRFVLKGKVINGKGYSIILDRLEVGKMEPLSTQDLNSEGEFRLDGKIREPELYQLRLNTGVIHVPVYPGDDLYFTIDYNHPENFQVNGSLEPVYLRDMYYLIEKTNDKITAIEDLQENITDKTKLSRMADTLPKYYSRIEKEKFADLRKFATKLDTAFTALLAAGRLSADDPENFAFLENIDKKFAAKYPYSTFYKGVHDKVLAYAPVSPGHLIPDIIATDLKGTSWRLSKMKGKTTLVYFWNSQCIECIEQFPALSRLYEKYKAKGFDVFAINIDNDRAQWITAMNDNKIPGIQVNDIGGYQSSSAQTLLANTTPYTYLLDKEGRIISKNQTMRDLEKNMKKVFGF